MIKLRKNSCAARLYLFSAIVWGRFLNKDRDTELTNLCTYMRTVFIWMPITIMVHAALYAWIGFIFLIYPIMAFGSGYGVFWFWAMVCGTTIAGLAFLLVFLMPKFHTTICEATNCTYIRASRSIAWYETSTFFILIVQYLKDRHEKMCSTITISGDDQ